MHTITTLLAKIEDPDPDIRFMQLSDLSSILNQSSSEYLRTDAHTSAKVVDKLIKTLTDTIGEVQSQALKCVGPLSTRIPNEYLAPFLDKILELTDKATDSSVPVTAVRSVVVALPRPSATSNEKDTREAFSAVSKVLVPKLVGYLPTPRDKKPAGFAPGLLQQQKDKTFSADAVELANEVVKCYGPLLHDEELVALAAAALEIIGSRQANGVVKKRALLLLSSVALFQKTSQLDKTIAAISQNLQETSLPVNHRRYLVAATGSIIRAVPARVSVYLGALIPSVVSVLSQEELDATNGESDDDAIETNPEVEELREAALITLETALLTCTLEMQAYLSDCLAAALRYIKYDPTVFEVDDENMGGLQDEASDDGTTEDQMDDDDEYAELDDDDFADTEDLSWKVRRCAAKLLLAIVSSYPVSDHKLLFDELSPVLISRLNSEREDNVRLEIMAAITALVQKASLIASARTDATSNGTTAIANPNKRKRVDSFDDQDPDLRGLVQSRSSPPFEPPVTPTGPHADLANLIPKIVQVTVRMWKKASVALKQAVVLMLRAIALSRNGALADHLQQLEDALADALKLSGSATTVGASGLTATPASLQIETLTLVSTLAETNGSSVLAPFVVALINPVTSLVRDKNYKVAGAALQSVEQFVKALTPPRSAASQDHSLHIQTLYDVVLLPVNDVSADLEVRHKAIRVFGLLLARTSGTDLLSTEARTKGLGVVDDRLKNETMRLETAQAIGVIAEATTQRDKLGPAWVQEVSVELANQLRKSDRVLRVTCLEALQYLALNPVTSSQYSTDTIIAIQAQILPLIKADDLNLLTPALVVLARIIPTNPQALVNTQVVEVLCKLSESRLEGPPLKAYLLVIKVIGEQQLGQPLMTGLLAVGTSGDTHVLGRAIGTLIVFAEDQLGVTVDAFVGEVDNKDDASACLALTVLGEISLRLGARSPVSIDILTRSLSAKGEKTRLAAAVALGSASLSNVNQYMPAIMQGLATPGQDYLYLYALKQILQYSEDHASISKLAPELWKVLLAVSSTEDKRVVGADCIGRLVLLEPDFFLPALSHSLAGQDAAFRATIISAFRFTLNDVSDAFTITLNKAVVPLLQQMLSDSDLSNRRLAVTTFTTAIQHKQAAILPFLDQLLPIILTATHVDKSLIKVVKIGPFTHHEDSGLDLRKSAYSALYTLVETPAAIAYLNVPSILDRVQDGIADDQDIRTLSTLMLSRLSDLCPDATKAILPLLADKFKKVLDVKPKENAVKQEIEKINEANAVVVRSAIELSKKFPQASASADSDMMPWRTVLEYINKEHQSMVKTLMNDVV